MAKSRGKGPARTAALVSVAASLLATIMGLSEGNWALAGVGAALCLAALVVLAYVG